MKSDVITITNRGEGFEQALAETKKVAAYKGLTTKESLHLQLLTEEVLSTARIISGEMKASFWLECEDKSATLHMTTNTILDKKRRAQLIDASTTRKNEAANSFLGMIRDEIEQAMAADYEGDQIPSDVEMDIVGRQIEDTEWDEYECSILRKLADEVKVSIAGQKIDMTVKKDFAKQA